MLKTEVFQPEPPTLRKQLPSPPRRLELQRPVPPDDKKTEERQPEEQRLARIRADEVC